MSCVPVPHIHFGLLQGDKRAHPRASKAPDRPHHVAIGQLGVVYDTKEDEGNHDVRQGREGPPEDLLPQRGGGPPCHRRMPTPRPHRDCHEASTCQPYRGPMPAQLSVQASPGAMGSELLGLYIASPALRRSPRLISGGGLPRPAEAGSCRSRRKQLVGMVCLAAWAGSAWYTRASAGGTSRRLSSRY
jgi:hypothetical protein